MKTRLKGEEGEEHEKPIWDEKQVERIYMRQGHYAIPHNFIKQFK